MGLFRKKQSKPERTQETEGKESPKDAIVVLGIRPDISGLTDKKVELLNHIIKVYDAPKNVLPVSQVSELDEIIKRESNDQLNYSDLVTCGLDYYLEHAKTKEFGARNWKAHKSVGTELLENLESAQMNWNLEIEKVKKFGENELSLLNGDYDYFSSLIPMFKAEVNEIAPMWRCYDWWVGDKLKLGQLEYVVNIEADIIGRSHLKEK